MNEFLKPLKKGEVLTAEWVEKARRLILRSARHGVSGSSAMASMGDFTAASTTGVVIRIMEATEDILPLDAELEGGAESLGIGEAAVVRWQVDDDPELSGWVRNNVTVMAMDPWGLPIWTGDRFMAVLNTVLGVFMAVRASPITDVLRIVSGPDEDGLYDGFVQRLDVANLTWSDMRACKIIDANTGGSSGSVPP